MPWISVYHCLCRKPFLSMILWHRFSTARWQNATIIKWMATLPQVVKRWTSPSSQVI
jgi:hypothetical protein